MTRSSPCRFAARSVLLGVLATLLWAGPAAATWSIVAADDETGEVGVAFASCVPGEVLGRLDEPLVPVVLVPGVAAAIAQGQLDTSAPNRIVELVSAGADAADIVAEITADEVDELASVRQYGAVRLPGSVAGYTGDETSPEALDRQGELLSVQGNLLAGRAVVDDAALTFEQQRAGGATLADALVSALQAGADAGGDRRCGQQTALFAQVAVAGPDDGAAQPSVLLTVTVDEGDGQNPVELLVEAHRQGRLGVIEAGSVTDATGSSFPVAVLAAAAVMVAVGGVALVRGMGSIRARR